MLSTILATILVPLGVWIPPTWAPSEVPDALQRILAYEQALESQIPYEPTITYAPAPQLPTGSVYRGMGSDWEQWRGLVSVHWPSSLVDWAICVVEHESGGNPNAKNPYSEARGLFQVMASVWAAPFGLSYSDLYKPEVNVTVAYQIYLAQGPTAWAVHNDGKC